MHIRQIVFLSALPAWMVSSAGAGQFQNLNFEQATIPPTPAGQFLVSQTHNDARVTLDGTVIPLMPIGGGRMAGDVTTFAGREAQLMFSTTSYNVPWL